MKTQPEFVGRAAKPAERGLIRALAEDNAFRNELVRQLQQEQLHRGLQTEKVFAALILADASDGGVQATEVAVTLDERDRRLLYEILFEDVAQPTQEELEWYLNFLRSRQLDAEIESVKAKLLSHPIDAEFLAWQGQIQELQRRKAALLHPNNPGKERAAGS